MEAVWKLIAAAILCSILCLLLQKQSPELTAALCVLGCVLCLSLALPLLAPVVSFLRRLEELTQLSGAIFAPLLKTVAVGILTQLAAAVCRDSGRQALAKAVEVCSSLACMYLALPLFEMALSLLQDMIGG